MIGAVPIAAKRGIGYNVGNNRGWSDCMARKIIMYGNEHCPTCNEVKEVFDREGIRYGYVDILAGLAHLKKFLNLRDNNPEAFSHVVAEGKIGIPAVVVDEDTVYGELQAEGLDISLFR